MMVAPSARSRFGGRTDNRRAELRLFERRRRGIEHRSFDWREGRRVGSARRLDGDGDPYVRSVVSPLADATHAGRRAWPQGGSPRRW
jgi:hypothetical protein